MTTMEITMPNARFYYAQPLFRASSPDFEKLKGQTEWTLDTPGIGLALAFDYYRFEAFTTADDRDACCGPTAHPDVSYGIATAKDLRQNKITMDDIACGVAVDHPHFEEIMAPLFDAAMARLFGDMPTDPDMSGRLASTEILIARTRYTISAEKTGEWINFPVEAMTVFEKGDRDVTDRTLDWLHNRLVLTASPSLFNARPS
jgi:hypothetical protein